MATAAEIQAEIDAVDAETERARADQEQANQERVLAIERQRLRRILDEKRKVLERHRGNARCHRYVRALIDEDNGGPHMPDSVEADGRASRLKSTGSKGSQCSASQYAEWDCSSAVQKGELTWSIKGFSWLEDTIAFEAEIDYVASLPLHVGHHHDFRLCYHPKKGTMGSESQKASLAIMHINDDEPFLAFRYKLMVKSKDRGWVQWGEDGHEASRVGDMHMFGPDVVQGTDRVPAGVFGLTHEQLTKSEWVADDVLTVKLDVAVRTNICSDETDESPENWIAVPASSLTDDLLALLDSGVNSDLVFIVQGETIHAHSQVLGARSEVLRTQLACGIQEAISKRVSIEDCQPRVFKAFLRYLYSDDFGAIEKFLNDDKGGDSSRHVDEKSTAKESVQQLLALAHKYELSRLQLWCERQLGESISTDNVCSVLCQAHLYMAVKLEKKCLDFIKQNMNEVFTTEAFGSLQQKWPQVSLKITAHLASVPEEKVAVAMEVQQKTGKRKRDD